MNKLFYSCLKLSTFALAAVVLIMRGACAHELNKHARTGKTLVYCSEGSPAGFDVAQYGASTDYTASAGTVYNRLVEFERGVTKIKPGLAESWHISPSGRTYTFYLRRGVKFHTTPWFTPRREFNASDVVFTFERMRNPKLPFRCAYPAEFPDSAFFGCDKIEKIEALSPYVVRFTLKDINASFLSSLAAPIASILSAEYAEQLLQKGTPSEINEQPIGTGPFIFEKYVKDVTIRFRGNPEYWQPSDVKLSRLIFEITPDARVRVQKLKRNECQIMGSPLLENILELEADPRLQVLENTDFSISFLAYNIKHKALSDVRVRHALDMAIDKQAIIDVVFQGRAQAAVAPLPPPQWSYDASLKDPPHDLKKAKALLAQAGYPKGFSLTLWAAPVQRSYNSNARLTAEMIQADWEKIGVHAKIVSYEWAEFLKRAFHGEHDTVLMGGSGINDPDLWLSGFLGCRSMRSGNFSQWCNKSFDHLLQQAVRTLDMDKRTTLYLNAQKIFKRAQPYTALAYPKNYYVLSKNVTGFKTYPFGATVFYGVSLKGA